jgi:hypothetical protein
MGLLKFVGPLDATTLQNVSIKIYLLQPEPVAEFYEEDIMWFVVFRIKKVSKVIKEVKST